jgi:hypothetical protein
MAINRTNILRGPGTVIYNTGNDAQTIFDATGITADVESSSQEIPSSVSGAIDTIKTDQVGTIRLTPCGQLSDDLLALLYPYGTPSIGARVFPDADVPLTVHSVAGAKVTFVNAALTTMPTLTLSPVKTAFGEAVFTALLGLGKKPSDASSFFTTAAASYTAGGPDPTGIVGVQYAATFGSLNILDTLDGWTVTPKIQLQPVTTDLLGTVDYTVSGVTCTATCTPLGLTESQLLGALPIAKDRGSSLKGAADLVITGAGGLTVTLKNATMLRGPLQWGNTTLRAGEVQFTAHRAFTDGAPGAVFSVEMAA